MCSKHAAKQPASVANFWLVVKRTKRYRLQPSTAQKQYSLRAPAAVCTVPT
jgi:hypothetical protein